MKIAVLSDIHANYQALEAVMKDIKEQGCEKIFCLGDIAMAGPQPNEVTDYVQNQKDWVIIQGNTDKMIAEYTENLYEAVKGVYPVMAEALKDDVFIMKDDNINFLKNLPQERNLVIENVKVLLVHGSPRRNDENIFPDMPSEKIEEIVKNTDADLIFCGHTHIPCGYQTNSKKTVVNVGSTGRPMTEDAKACYVIADFNNGTFTIEHRTLDYDRESAAETVKKRNFKGSEILAEMILHPKNRHA